MDDTVLAALAKWPDVPAVYEWLGLSARGEWRLQGQPIGNVALREFIGRNYAADEGGRWYFQNGPQRVFVTLEVTPWVWRVLLDENGNSLHAHTGFRVRQLRGAWLDESGRVFLETELGFGLLDSRDTTPFLNATQGEGQEVLRPEDQEAGLTRSGPRLVVDGARLGLAGMARLEHLEADDMPGRFGFVRSPQPD
jgi:hypothetical protein